MQFVDGDPNLVDFTRVLIGDPSSAPNPLYSTQEVKDAINLAYDALYAILSDIDGVDVGIEQTTVTSIADQIFYSLPTGLISLELVEVDMSGNDLTSTVPSAGNITIYEIVPMRKAWKDYASDQMGSNNYAFIQGTNYGILPAPTTGEVGSDAIRVTYRKSRTLLSSDSDTPNLPIPYHELICLRASIVLRAARDLPIQDLIAQEEKRFNEAYNGLMGIAPTENLVKDFRSARN